MNPYVLIVENQETLLEAMQVAVESFYGGRVMAAEGAKDAIEILELEENGPEIVVSEAEMTDGSGDILFEYVKKKFPGTPFVFCSGESKEKLEKNFPEARAILQKPSILLPLRNLFAEITPEAATSKPYLPIRLSLLVKLGLLQFDLFLKLAENNFVKVVHKGDTFLPEDGKKYIEKRVMNLYLRQEDAEVFLNEFQALATCVSKTAALSPEELTIAGVDFLEATQKLAEIFGWTEDVMDAARKSVAIAIQAVSKSPKILSLLELKAGDASSPYTSHITTLSFLSCAIAQKLDWASELTQVKLAMAALLHDLTVDEKVYREVESWNTRASDRASTETEVAVYRNHPAKAAEEITQIPGLPPDVDQIVMQHHELPDGSGFPNGAAANRISPLACIFIFSEDLATYLLQAGEPRALVEKFLQERKGKYTSGTFRKIQKAFEESMNGNGES